MRLQPLFLLGVALVATLPALAQYKVVGPDGKVTYTDRPVPPPPGGQVQPLRAAAAAAAAARAPLPLELRAVADRFPVTLYTSPECPPCDSGRSLLQQRGIPYTERVVSSDDDTAALQRITNGRTVPALTVGGQALRGFLDTDWQATLDLAGYPKESKLPRGWSSGPPTPLVARAPAPDAAAQPARPAQPSAQVEPPAAAGGIRF
jgi:glutaredoxin